MRVRVLGTKGEIAESAPRHRLQSGILIDDVLLLDLGEKKYLRNKPRWIVITHLHPDHAYFVRRGHEESPDFGIPIYAPEKPKKGIHLLTKKHKLGPYTITPIPTHHSTKVLSQAYLIKKAGCSLLYTGDLVWIDKKYQTLLNDLDLVITDGSFIREGGMVRKDLKTGKLFGHNGVPNLIRLFQPYTKKILFVHFGAWFYKNIRQSRKKLHALGEKPGHLQSRVKI
jgi:ribonuclease BN (tRNA processing enzyme)